MNKNSKSNKQSKHLYIEIEIKELKLLGTYRVYFNSASRIDNFYKVIDTEGDTFTINTSKFLNVGNKIKAKVKGIKTYRGKGEIHLTKVSILEE